MRRLFGLALALALGVAPAAPTYAAGFRAYSPAQVRTWPQAFQAALPGIQAAPSAHHAELEQALGNLRFDLALRRGDEAASVLQAALPEEWKDRPAEFAALAPAEQSRILQAALIAARSSLEAQARGVLDGSAPPETLARLASARYFLSPDLRAAIAAALERKKAATLATTIGRLKASLLNEGTPDHAAEARKELKAVFAGVSQLADDRPEGAASGEYARTVLAPYAERALAQADERLRQRGRAGDSVRVSIIEKPSEAFAMAGARTIKTLRAGGDWNPLVAAMTMSAAREILPGRAAPVDYEKFRLLLPRWMPESGAHKTASSWMRANGPAAAGRAPVKGLQFFSLFGVPFTVTLGHLAMAPLLATSIGKISAPLLPAGYALAGFDFWLTAVMLSVSVLIHEMGHLFAGKFYGLPMSRLTLNAMGGGVHVERDPSSPGPNFWLAAAGPLMNFAFAAVLAALIHLLPGHFPVLTILAATNVAMGALNLIPMFPLDGGRVALAALQTALGDKYRAERAMGWLNPLGGALVAVALSAVYPPINTLLYAAVLAAVAATVSYMLLFKNAGVDMAPPHLD